MRRLALLLALLLAPLVARADGNLPGFMTENLRLDITVPEGRAQLEAMLIRSDRPGRLPLVVLVHGTPRGTNADFTAAIARSSPSILAAAAITFAQHGYAAVAIMRRGFGQSSGGYHEGNSGNCTDEVYTAGTQRSGEDVVGAVAALRERNDVAADRVLLLGVSTGGFAVTAAAARNPPGVVGVLDFAGGRGSRAPDDVCHPAGLVDTMGVMGRTARVPALWIYAENDHFFAPDLARRMFAAYTASGAPARLEIAAPFGDDGHSLVARAPPERWWPLVAPFLTSIGLPTDTMVPWPLLPAPAPASAACRRGFADYAALRDVNKAFATSPNGGCGWQQRARDTAAARDSAMKNCQKHSADCHLYAVGQRLVRE